MSRTRWGIGLLVGVFMGMILYVVLRPRYFSPTAAIGRRAGFDPPTYVDVRTIELKASKEHSLTSGEIESLRTHLDDKEPRIQARVLTALGFAGKDQAVVAASMVRTKLNDKVPVVRQYALGALAHLDAPDTTEAAQKLLSDPDPYVHKKAERILAKHNSTK